MRWRQLTPEECETVRSALAMMSVIHQKNGEILDRNWVSFLKRCAPELANPSLEVIQSVDEEFTDFGGAISSPRSRLLAAWALSQWALAIEMIGNVGSQDNFRKLAELPLESANKKVCPQEIKNLSQRLKNTLSKEEYTLLHSIVQEDYSSSSERNTFNALAGTYRDTLDDLSELALNGETLSKLMPQQWLLILQCLRKRIVSNESDQARKADIARMFIWIQSTKLLDMDNRITQTSSLNLDSAVSRIHRTTPGLRMKQVGTQTAYLRSYDRVTDNEIERLLRAVTMSGKNRSSSTILVRKNSENLSTTLFYKGEGNIASSKLTVPLFSEKGYTEMVLIGVSLNQDVTQSVLSTGDQKVAAELFMAEGTPHIRIRTNIGMAALGELLADNVEQLDGTVKYLALESAYDGCFNVEFGDRGGQVTSFVYPTNPEDFRQMIFSDVEEWAVGSSITVNSDLLSCPSCDSLTKRYTLFQCSETKQVMCALNKEESAWRKGCGYTWLDSYDADISLRTITHYNQLKPDFSMEE